LWDAAIKAPEDTVSNTTAKLTEGCPGAGLGSQSLFHLQWATVETLVGVPTAFISLFRAGHLEHHAAMPLDGVCNRECGLPNLYAHDPTRARLYFDYD
jgi:hypothetical protein